jgi:hypothetical protein
MAEARDVFRNPATTEFVIVTIPTAMAAAESIRLAKALRREQVPIRTLVLNQVLQPGLREKYLATRRADQQRALERLRADPQLAALQLIEAPLFDLEVGQRAATWREVRATRKRGIAEMYMPGAAPASEAAVSVEQATLLLKPSPWLVRCTRCACRCAVCRRCSTLASKCGSERREASAAVGVAW